MKRILTIVILGACAWWQAGCSSNAGVNVGPEGHQHGASIGGNAGRSGVGVNANAR
jgi:hypothetical protein